MQVQTQPLNPVKRQSLQQWLGKSECRDLRKVIRAKIAKKKQTIVVNTIKAVDDDQFLKDALVAGREVVFYERVLTLLGAAQLGYNPSNPDEEFEYETIEIITDQEPLTTE